MAGYILNRSSSSGEWRRYSLCNGTSSILICCDTSLEFVSHYQKTMADYDTDSTRGSVFSAVTDSDINALKVNMSSEVNNSVREKYRNLLITQQEKVDGAGEGGIDVDELRNMVLEANDAFKEVQRPREAALDAEFIKTCGVLVKKKIESMQFNSMQFNPDEYARKLIQFMSGEDESHINLLEEKDWNRFGKAVSALYINTPTIESAYAGYDIQVEKKQRQRRKVEKDEVATKVKPKLVDPTSNEEERQTEELNRIHKILRRRYIENKKEPICFFTFVVNPKSYTYTIENMFHTSFLVNEHRAQILEDENGLPVIMPFEPSASRSKSSSVPTSQAIVSLSTVEFREAVKTFKLKNSCIPSPQNRAKRSIE